MDDLYEMEAFLKKVVAGDGVSVTFVEGIADLINEQVLEDD
jgi:hypothetical protein